MCQQTRHRVRLPGPRVGSFGGWYLGARNREARRATIPHTKFSLALLILGLLPTLALGQSIRCASKLINEGMSQAKVAALCGQPVQVVHPTDSNGVVPGAYDVQEEIWTYNFGPNKLMQRIRFRNGIVANISSAGYGY